MRLIGFGCSYTAGQGFPDYEYRVGSKYVWPFLVAKRLGIECFNLGEPGGSIKYIAKKVYDFSFDKDDIVVIMYPEISRTCIIKGDSYHDIMSFYPSSEDEFTKNWYKNYSDKFDEEFNANLYKEFIKHYLKDKVKLQLHCNLYNSLYYEDCAMYGEKFFKDLRPGLKFSFPTLPDGHLGYEAHREFSSRLIKDIEQELNIKR